MLHLHIGRPKAGSTTLQRLLLRHAGLFNGLACPVAPNGTANQVELAGRLHDGDLAAAEALAGFGPAVVSSEFLWSLGPEAMEAIRTAAPDIQVIAYVRDYPSWVVSRFGQAGRKGRRQTAVDFDAWLTKAYGLISAAHQVEAWAAALGPRLRLRVLGDLPDGLMRDFLDAVGVKAAAPPGVAGNVSPPWWQVEVLRRLPGLDPLARRQLMRNLPAAGVPERAQYLTSDQHRRLARMFNRDLERFEAVAGMGFSRISEEIPERPFLPGVEHIPAAIREELVRRAEALGISEQLEAAGIRPG